MTRRLPPFDKAKTQLIDELTSKPAGSTTPLKTPPAPEDKSDDLSIDSLLADGLVAINRLMKSIMQDISAGTPDRDTVQNLKDVMAMLRDLKKDEQGILDNLSTEELERLANQTRTGESSSD